ncbi:serine/threonine protein kinase [Nocardia yunnanensis]|uniref:non-specific serine/threonine protein kinase n=1 Tax=Nocardia yunnanensis TaxID=2382165 RepID=A0A386ZGG4_9NOCA|nr:serine/threonine-protein kinase [Nocardia yunnanensis]AYF76546.1 serine/threonine protein kinase [Nocardia yunnanensis]
MITELRPGEVIAGYVIARRIGAGGSGVVYAARHPRLPRLTALKILKRDDVADVEDGWRRFEREADIAAHFDHPNIVQVYDRGAADDLFWISMQFVDGVDAAELHDVSPDRGLRIATEIAAALDYAHGKGVLHRDVKPSNILIAAPDNGRPERALLTDFGIARLRDETTKFTHTGNISATFAFASPEQVSGKPVGPKSDQYSLACTLFVLLTDHRPFRADNPLSWVHAHTQERPLPVSEVNPDLPPALDAVFERAMAKNPEDRFDSCADFAEAATQAYYSDPALALTAPARLLSRPVAARRAGRARKPLWRAVFHRRTLIPVAVAAVVAAGIGFAFHQSGGGPVPAPAAGGLVPDRFVGTWLATEGQTNYRLTVQQAKLGDPVLSNRVDGVLPNGTPFHCEFSAPLDEVPGDGDRLIVGTSEIVVREPANACKANGPTTLTLLPDGRVSRKTDVSGLITYSNADAVTSSWGRDDAAIASAFPSLVGRLASTGTAVGWQGGLCRAVDPGAGEPAQGAHRVRCNADDTTGQVHFDVLDFDTRPGQSVAQLFFGDNGHVTAVSHQDVAGTLTVTTAAAVDPGVTVDTDAHRTLAAVSFPDGDPRSRFVMVLHWPGHTVNSLLTDWLERAPLK